MNHYSNKLEGIIGAAERLLFGKKKFVTFMDFIKIIFYLSLLAIIFIFGVAFFSEFELTIFTWLFCLVWLLFSYPVIKICKRKMDLLIKQNEEL